MLLLDYLKLYTTHNALPTDMCGNNIRLTIPFTHLPISSSPILHFCFSADWVTKSVLLHSVPHIKVNSRTYLFWGNHLFLCLAKHAVCNLVLNSLSPTQGWHHTHILSNSGTSSIILILLDSRRFPLHIFVRKSLKIASYGQMYLKL